MIAISNFPKPGARISFDDNKLEEVMNGPVKKALGLNATWGEHSGTVFDVLSEDFMKPVTSIGIIKTISKFINRFYQ